MNDSPSCLRPPSVQGVTSLWECACTYFAAAKSERRRSAVAAPSQRHRPDVGATSQRHRSDIGPDIGPTSQRHRSDIGPTSARRRSDVAAPSQPHRPDIGPTSARRHCDMSGMPFSATIHGTCCYLFSAKQCLDARTFGVRDGDRRGNAWLCGAVFSTSTLR